MKNSSSNMSTSFTIQQSLISLLSFKTCLWIRKKYDNASYRYYIIN